MHSATSITTLIPAQEEATTLNTILELSEIEHFERRVGAQVTPTQKENTV